MASYDVFTPSDIAATMRSFLPAHVDRLLEPSVGTGNLLQCMEGCYGQADVVDINPSYLSRVPDRPTLRKTCGDFLTMTIDSRYDAILMNPPYLRYQDMTADQRQTIRAMSPVLCFGNVDLYMAFLVKCLDLLTETGRLVAIVPSAWRYTKSATPFRNWIMSGRHLAAIHDYGSTRIFKGIHVYCCIVVLTRQPNHQYTVNGEPTSYTPILPAPSLQTLGHVATLQNGIATLCDSVFVHDKPLFDEPCWRPILKVSKRMIRSILFPYAADGTILSETEFQTANPQTYAYLRGHRTRLAQRDRGKKTYEQWYAFGRRQGLNVPTSSPTSLYISALCAPSLPSFEHPTMLFYSGIRVTPTGTSCKNIQHSIEQHRSVLLHSSAKRANGWVTLSSSTLRQVPIVPASHQTDSDLSNLPPT